MPRMKQNNRSGRRQPLVFSLTFVLCASIALSGCVSPKGKDGVAEFLTPDAESVAAATPGSAKAYKDTLVNAADPSPEYLAQAASQAVPGETAGAPQGAAPGEPQPAGNVVMQATGINANRSSIFSAQAPAQPAPTSENGAAPADPSQTAPSTPGGFNATNSSMFSTSGKNPLLQSSNAEKGDKSSLTAYMGDDDIPLILRGKLYSSSDLGPDPSDAATDMVSLASLPSMTRQSATGLIVQSPRVQTSCFKPKLVSMLHEAETHFGKKIVVTSGFRDPEHNLAVGGAKHSMHLSCDAADIQMVGVSKWDLARYFRSRAGIGGVGTYCSTNSIHVDIGNRRDWNWKCRPDTEL